MPEMSFSRCSTSQRGTCRLAARSRSRSSTIARRHLRLVRLLIDGVPHARADTTTVCQAPHALLKEGDALTLEPWRARAFPLVRDSSSIARVRSHHPGGGYITAPTGSAPTPTPSCSEGSRGHGFDAAADRLRACVAACRTRRHVFTAAEGRAPECASRRASRATSGRSTWSPPWAARCSAPLQSRRSARRVPEGHPLEFIAG